MEELATQMKNLARRRAAEPGGERWNQRRLRKRRARLRSGKATSASRPPWARRDAAPTMGGRKGSGREEG
jgi:hypothetical protein